MKNRILEILYDRHGQLVSGQAICDELGISRTAVWKHIKNLRAEGYEITSVEGKGYSMKEGRDLLNGYEIRRRLLSDMPVFYFNELDSTNNEARKIAAETTHEIALVTCSVQKSGRGRMGRSFESSNEKGAWCSFIMKPEIEPGKAVMTTIAAAEAVSKTIEQIYGFKPGIKWPNDIIAGKKKICGILSEMNCETNIINHIIVGIGLNLNQESGDFSEDTAEIAESLLGITGRRINRSEIIAALCYNIQEAYRLISEGKTEEILECWRKYSITDGKMITVLKNGETTKARALGIDENGNLITESPEGKREVYGSGEISIRGIMDRS